MGKHKVISNEYLKLKEEGRRVSQKCNMSIGPAFAGFKDGGREP